LTFPNGCINTESLWAPRKTVRMSGRQIELELTYEIGERE